MTRGLPDDVSVIPALRSGPLRPDSAEDLMVRLLQNLGSRKEVEQYLRLFSSVEEQRFAVIKVSGGVVQSELEALASSIAFLDKVGLTPVIIHGAGPQLKQAEEAAGVHSTINEAGERVISAESIGLARKVFQRENLRIVNALEALGTRARPIPTGVFAAEPVDDGRLGYVGHVTGVDLEAIDASIQAEQGDGAELVFFLVFQEDDRVNRSGTGELMHRHVGDVELRGETEAGDLADLFACVAVAVDGNDFFKHGNS